MSSEIWHPSCLGLNVLTMADIILQTFPDMWLYEADPAYLISPILNIGSKYKRNLPRLWLSSLIRFQFQSANTTVLVPVLLSMKKWVCIVIQWECSEAKLFTARKDGHKKCGSHFCLFTLHMPNWYVKFYIMEDRNLSWPCTYENTVKRLWNKFRFALSHIAWPSLPWFMPDTGVLVKKTQASYLVHTATQFMYYYSDISLETGFGYHQTHII